MEGLNLPAAKATEHSRLLPMPVSHRYTHLGVGRNKPARALSAGQVFPAFRKPGTAGNARPC
ncbi:MAG: hypothetical protein WC856_18145 [Methylococcaceae bacterium]|jgi:hypothetical protein